MINRKTALTSIVLLLVTMFGCTSQTSSQAGLQQAASSAAGKGAEKIIIAQPAISESWLPVYLADKLGYYNEAGLKVEYATFSGGGPLVIASLMAGDSQFALTGYDQVLKTYDQGKSTKMIMATSNRNPWALVVGKDIKSFADLKGKKVGGGMEGSSVRAFVRACLKYGGLDPNKDVEYVNVPTDAVVGALERGDIAAVMGSGLNKVEFQKRGYTFLVDLTDPQQHQKVIGSKEFPLYVVQVTDDLIKNRPATVENFTNAVVRAMKWQNSHSSEEIADQISSFYPNTAKDALVTDIKDTQLTLSPDGYFTKEGHAAVINSALDVGMIKRAVAMENVVDDSFLKKAHAKYAK